MSNQLTPDRIKELRDMIAAATTWHNATFLIAARKDFPSALNTIEARDARIAELEAALKPFADDAAAYDPDQFDDHDHAYCNRFEVGHLRSARSALQPKEPTS